MGMYQGGSQYSRGDNGDIEGTGGAEKEAYNTDLVTEFALIKGNSHFQSHLRMEVDIRTLIEIFADPESDRRDPSPVIFSLSNYFESTPQGDTKELSRRLQAAKDRVVKDVREQITDEEKAEKIQNLLMNILVVRSVLKLTEFEINRNLEVAHQVFIHSHITPLINSVEETLKEFELLKQESNLSQAEIRRWINDHSRSLAKMKRAGLRSAESWNKGHSLAIAVSVRGVLDSFEEDVLPPIVLGGPWRDKLGSLITEQFTKQIKSAAADYILWHKNQIEDAFLKFKNALPPSNWFV